MKLVDDVKREAIARIRKGLDAINGRMAERSDLGNRPFFSTEDFPWVKDVESEWLLIREELEKVMTHWEQIPHFSDVSKDQAHLTAYGNWKTFFLWAYGHRAEENCTHCPETARIVERIPGMKTAMFSIFRPGTQVKPHRGPYKGLLRYHLALKVPKDPKQCGIRVGGQVEHWQEGRSLIFDDVFEHEAWNDSDEIRVVLFVDFERPLPPFWAFVNRLLIGIVERSPLVRDGIRNYEEWTRKHPLPR